MNLEFANGSKITGISSENSIRGEMSQNIEWCFVCNNSKEHHLAFRCDGETCIYCGGIWDECDCGEPTRRR